MKKTLRLMVMLAVFLTFLIGGQALAAGVTTYKVPVISDFTGGYAELFKAWVPVHKAVVAWWNDTEGKKLGVKLELKHYDGRYDPTVIASMWPGVLAECKPAICFGGGGADVAALQQRFITDKVPTIYGTATYGYGWLPNQWLFQVRPTYVQEFLTALVWFINKHPDKKPIKVGTIAVDVPAALDANKGFEKYINEVLGPKGLAKQVVKKYSTLNPVDLSTQVKAIIDAKADIVFGPITTAMSVAYMKACQTYGVNIPTIASPHHTIFPYARAMKTYAPFEGHLVVAAHASVTKKDSPAYKWFQVLHKNYKLSEKFWNVYSMMALNQSILAVRAFEHAAKRVGADKVTGQAVYDAMFAAPFTYDELMGTLPDLYFTKDAPFSQKHLRVRIETVKGGKYVLADPDWVPIPTDIKKW